MKFRKANLKAKLCQLALIPVICLGFATLIIASVSVYISTANETKDGLKNLAYMLHQMCEIDGQGDYWIRDNHLMKGQDIFDNNYKIVDNIKAFTSIDATIFYGDTRMITTIHDDGKRAIGTHAQEDVIQTVLKEGKDYFSRQISINDVSYFGYYTPLTNSDGSIIGMVFVGKARIAVIEAVMTTVFWIFLLTVLVAGMTSFISMHYARNVVYSIEKTKEFLGNIAKGNVEQEVDPHITSRADEIGEMGTFLEDFKLSINEMVSTDSLTGLYNRRSCEAVLKNMMDEYKTYKTESVIVMGDVDLFKNINDTYGHQFGDVVLQQLSKIFTEHMEHKGIVSRWGGEEFMFVYERMPLERVRIHLEELRDCINQLQLSYKDEMIHVSMTFGVAVCHQESDLKSLIQLADDNMYYGKKHGRNQIVIFDSEKGEE